MSATATMGLLQPFFSLPYLVKLLLIALIVGGVFFFFARTASGQVFLNYLNDSKKELRRITWPTTQETMNSVWIVSAFVVFAAAFWWLIDAAITKVFALLLRVLA